MAIITHEENVTGDNPLPSETLLLLHLRIREKRKGCKPYIRSVEPKLHVGRIQLILNKNFQTCVLYSFETK